MLVRSIQNNRTANFLAAATFATPFFMRWQRCLYCLRNPSSSRHTVCTLSTSSMRRNGFPCLLIDPRSPSLTRAVFARDQTQVAGHLLATLEACHISHRDYIGQGRDGTDPGLRHQQARSRVLLRRLLDRLVQLRNLWVQFARADSVNPVRRCAAQPSNRSSRNTF